jgi:Domain of unknown function (DUF1854)
MQLENQVPLPPSPGHETRSEPRIERTITGALRIVTARGATLARALRCFPWSEPNRHISIRDTEGNELLYVEDLARLDEGSRRALEGALTTAGFVIDVTGVDAVVEDFEMRCLKVQTRHGPRSLQTALDAWPRRAPNGEVLLVDIAGDIYRIPPMEMLDRRSRRLLWALLD